MYPSFLCGGFFSPTLPWFHLAMSELTDCGLSGLLLLRSSLDSALPFVVVTGKGSFFGLVWRGSTDAFVFDKDAGFGVVVGNDLPDDDLDQDNACGASPCLTAVGRTRPGLAGLTGLAGFSDV